MVMLVVEVVSSILGREGRRVKCSESVWGECGAVGIVSLICTRRPHLNSDRLAFHWIT